MAHPKATRDKLRGLYINGQSLEAEAIKTVDLLSQHIKQYFPQLNNDFLNVFESFIPVIEQEF